MAELDEAAADAADEAALTTELATDETAALEMGMRNPTFDLSGPPKAGPLE
jgi:hypothetical protein